MKKYIKIISLVLSLIVLASSICSCASKVNPISVKAGELENPVAKTLDREFKNSLYNFSMELLKKSISNEENTFISSYSVLSALALLYNGSNGDTKAQFEKLMGMDIDTLNSYLYQFNSSLIERNSNDVSLSLANSIWVNENMINVNEVYLQKTMGYYKADIFREDFTNPELVKNINNWCYENTGKMIKEIIDEVNPLALMYLMNAIYFEGKWDIEYKDENIQKNVFYNYHKANSNIEYLCSEETKGFVSNDDSYVGVKKDYKNGKYSFVAILPSENIDIYDFVNSLNEEKYKEIFANPFNGKVITKIPKMDIKYDLEMKEIISDMGLNLAFDSENADFKGLGESEGNIFVSKIIHKAALNVDEKGTKAAAVTIIETRTNAMPIENNLLVTLNRPFVLFIIDNDTNIPLFSGVITDI